ncbi:MAG: LPS export ABC transporter periplasmic protein LptC [Bacteroidales bacterium]|jgi:LPS export ABC transporter protein LptC|nr:LPS export ABC transporter periplasmic protein LptC [Bacteroidales bacterium]
MRTFHKYGGVILILWGSFSCANDMAMINKIVDPEEEPDMTAYNVEMLYSDSAYLQMKFVTPFVKQFTSAQKPRDEFPEGIHVRFYEKTGELKAEITANWAIHDHAEKLWEARSNVVLSNDKGEKLESEQMFWDQEKGIVYSRKFTKYTSETGNTAIGRNGMHAKQDFSEWTFLSSNATLMFQDEANGAVQNP